MAGARLSMISSAAGGGVIGRVLEAEGAGTATGGLFASVASRLSAAGVGAGAVDGGVEVPAGVRGASTGSVSAVGSGDGGVGAGGADTMGADGGGIGAAGMGVVGVGVADVRGAGEEGAGDVGAGAAGRTRGRGAVAGVEAAVGEGGALDSRLLLPKLRTPQ